jgi:FkbM family methyltransferase
VHERIYATGIQLLQIPMGLPALRQPLTWFAKVWLRHARIVSHLERAGYDAVVDGGAGIGEFAALVKLALPKASLLCVEPHPASAAALRKRGFTVVEAALWRERGETVLTQPEAAPTSCTLLASDDGERPSWLVGTVRLDDLGVDGQRVMVKLDLQGAEPVALEGMGRLWDRCAGLLLEVSYGDGGTYEPLRARLSERGFVEAATLNELETGVGVVEADKLFVRRGRLA